MTDVINFTKTAFTWSVVALTILWSVGAASLAAPVAANAAECPALEAGDFVRSYDAPDVYVIDEDMALHYMDNGMVAASWPQYSSSAVNYVETSCLGAYTFATTQPGVGYATGLVKQPINPAVYYIALDGTLYYVPSEAVAAALFGANWASLVRDIVPAFAINYGGFNTVAGDLSTDMLPENSLVMYNDAYWVHMDGAVYPVDGTLPQYHMDRAIRATDAMLSGVEVMTDSVTALESLDILRNTDAGDSNNGGGNGSETPVAEGNLELSLAASTPDSQNIPYDVVGHTYTTILAEAGDEPVEITGLTVERAGLGLSSDFEKVYVVVDGVRHGSKRTLGSDDEASLYFATAQNKIVVPANGSVEIDIVADMVGTSADSGNVSYLQVTEVQTNADVDARFPIRGNNMALANVAGPSIDFEYSGDDDDISIGDMQVDVAEFELDGDSSEDVMLYSVTLKQEGTADIDEVVNYTLYYEGDVVAGPVDARADDFVMFELDEPFLLEEDETNYTFTVKADVMAGNGETVELELEERTDIVAMGVENDFMAAPANNDSANADDAHEIQGGALTLTEHDNNPSSESYAPKTTNVLFFAAEAEAEDETVVVTEFEVRITKGSGNIDTTAGNVEIEEFEVTLDGRTVCGPVDLDSAYTAASTIVVSCTDDFEVEGTQELRVTGDLTEESESTYTVSVLASSFAIEDVEGDALYSTGTTYDVSGNVTGGTVTVDSGTLSLSKKANYTNRTITTGADAYKIGSYTLRAPESQGVDIDSVTVEVSGTYGVANLSDLYLSTDTGSVVRDPSASEEFGKNFDLAADQTMTLDVFASLDSNSTGTIITALTISYDGMEDDVTATVTTTGQTVTVAEGSLAVTRDASSPDADLVAGGTTGQHVYSVEFDPSYDTYTLQNLDITVSNPAAVTAVYLNGDMDTEVPVVAGEAQFTNLDMAIPSGGLVVDVYANFNIVDSDSGLASGVTTTFDVAGYEADADEGDDVNVTSATVDASDVFVVRNSFPTLAYTAGAEAATRGLLAVGDNELVKMTVSANEGIVEFKGLTLDITTDDASTTANIAYVELLDKDGDQLATTSVATAESGWDLSGLNTTDKEIGAGSSKVYYISVNLSGIAESDQVAVKVTDITWDDDVETGDIDGSYIEVLDSPRFLATENS